MSRGLAYLVIMLTANGLVVAADDLVALVARLPTNSAAGPAENAAENELVARGGAALAALERELRLGIDAHALNDLLRRGESRRGAVVRVLARIDSPASTDLLVRCAADHPDSYGMLHLTLLTLDQRTLTDAQVAILLASHDPQVALVGIGKAAGRPACVAALGLLFDPASAKARFANEFGAATANDEQLWQVRLASGVALGRDMADEKRARAELHLAALRTAVDQLGEPRPAERMSAWSAAETAVMNALARLADLGPVAREVVERARPAATGVEAALLDMALLRLGDAARLAAVATTLTDAPQPSLRLAAALSLRLARSREAMPALRRALRDPWQREDGSDVGPPGRTVYPVRQIAADALIDLGEDPAQVRAAAR